MPVTKGMGAQSRTRPVVNDTQSTQVQPMQPFTISDLLAADRIALGRSISSKKRLMEQVASMLARSTEFNEQTVFRVLIDRERLGSTGIGNGVALPHGRMQDLDEAVLSLTILDEPLDYQAPDQRNVQIVVGLLVPENANEFHLQLLARLAGLLSDPNLRKRLLQARDAEQITAALRDAESE